MGVSNRSVSCDKRLVGNTGQGTLRKEDALLQLLIIV